MPESTQYPGVPLFKARPVVYKLGLISLVCSFIFFIIGFSSPYWISYEYVGDMENRRTIDSYKNLHISVDLHGGLWNAPCFSSGAACNTGILVAQIAFSFHLAGYIIALAVAVYENCKKVNPVSYHSRVLELCVFITGILGTAGMAVFVVWYSTSFLHSGFRWSLAVTSLSLTGIYVTFFLLFFGNRKQCFTTQGTVFMSPQQGTVIYYNAGNPASATVTQTYRPPHSGHQIQHEAQNLPLLPPQPYIYPPISHQLGAPPAYALPPAYSSSPSQPQNLTYPGYNEYQQQGHIQASAPPYDGPVLQKS